MKYVLFNVCVLLFLHSVPVFAEQTIVVGIPESQCSQLDDCKSLEAIGIISEAYRRAGLEVRFVELPMLRDLVALEHGRIDASYSRTQTAVEKYPNLIQVPVPYACARYSAFYLNPDLDVKSKNDLKGLRVGVFRGDIAGTDFCTKSGVTPYHFNSMVSGFKMLKLGRLDVLVTDSVVGRVYSPLSGIVECRESGILYIENTYHTLNKKYSYLVPRLAAAFRSMYRDGSLKRLAGKFAYMIPDYDPDNE